MLFDEVTAALDPETVKEVLVTIKDLAAEGMTCILVTHEMGFAREVADHIYFTDRGVIVEHGPPATFFDGASDPRTREFLGQILQSGHSVVRPFCSWAIRSFREYLPLVADARFYQLPDKFRVTLPHLASVWSNQCPQ